jgi:hypothetical protein
MPRNAKTQFASVLSVPRPRPVKARPTIRDLIDPRLHVFLDLASRAPEEFAAFRTLAESHLAYLDEQCVPRRRRRAANE